MADYFSDRELGPRARTTETISPRVWGGIVSLVHSLITSGAFGARFPELCPDGVGTIGTDEHALSLAVQAEIPDLVWPLELAVQVQSGFFTESKPIAPDTTVVLDFVEFCCQTVAKPIQGKYHGFFGHHHLTFDREAGKEEFRASINRIFVRNGIAFELGMDELIVRVLPGPLGSALGSAIFRTGDSTLDEMLEDSRSKFTNPHPRKRREALERLWDCWERVKSLEIPDNKKNSIRLLLNKAADGSPLLKVLEDEARQLTDIGNSFHIRHSETSQQAVTDAAHIDYLFYRLFGLIQLLLGKSRRTS